MVSAAAALKLISFRGGGANVATVSQPQLASLARPFKAPDNFKKISLSLFKLIHTIINGTSQSMTIQESSLPAVYASSSGIFSVFLGARLLRRPVDSLAASSRLSLTQ